MRRSKAGGDKGKGSTVRDLERLFLTAQQDRHRPSIGLSPLPMPVPPPPPPSKYASVSHSAPSHTGPSSSMHRHDSSGQTLSVLSACRDRRKDILLKERIAVCCCHT